MLCLSFIQIAAVLGSLLLGTTASPAAAVNVANLLVSLSANIDEGEPDDLPDCSHALDDIDGWTNSTTIQFRRCCSEATEYRKPCVSFSSLLNQAGTLRQAQEVEHQRKVTDVYGRKTGSQKT